MRILLIGAGAVTSRLNVLLAEHGHTIEAQMAAFAPQHLELFDFHALVVVSPESTVGQAALTKAAENGKLIYVIAGAADGLAAWANAVGVPAVAYPPSEIDLDNLLQQIQRGEAGNLAADDQYRRAVLGSDIAARLQSGMAIRKIAVTSPKGGTGKTTVAVNLAVTFALCGITTCLVDSDANAGALQYHLRLDRVNTTMIALLRRELAKKSDTMAAVAAGAAFMNAFTPVEGLPTLRVLPGRVSEILGGLYESGMAGGGVVIMDVGINPAHVVHRAALRLAEGIAIVIKPEIPDLAETRRWLARMIGSLSASVGKSAAYEFIGSRVKLCYNQVVGDGFKSAHRMLQDALREDKIELALIPNGVLPMVDPRLAAQAVNSDRREDVLVWRYKREKLEELAPFTENMVGFASHFVPAVHESADRIGLLRRTQKTKRGLFGR